MCRLCATLNRVFHPDWGTTCKCRVGKSINSFSSELLVFCGLKMKDRFDHEKSERLPSLKRLVCSRSLFFEHLWDQFANVRSFLKIDRQEQIDHVDL